MDGERVKVWGNGPSDSHGEVVLVFILEVISFLMASSSIHS